MVLGFFIPIAMFKKLSGDLLLKMLLPVLLIRLISIFVMGPMPQDAYYFFYAQHPALSYFDHPPAIAYLLGGFTALLGKQVYVIKLADSLLTAGTVIALYQLSKRFYPGENSRKVILLFLSTLMVSILSLVSTPDTPLLFFWTLSLIALHDAIFASKKYSWIIAGILMGLAFDSKYTAVFIPGGVFLFLLLSASKRKFLLTIWPWLSLLLMILVSAPVIIWNMNNHFASFAFQGSQRMKAASAFALKPTYVLGLIGHQMALLIPVALIAILWAVVRVFKIHSTHFKEIPVKTIFLLSFFLPIFLTFLLLSPIYWIKINWMMPAYITGIILAGAVIKEKWLKIQLALSLVVHVALLVEIIFYPFPIRSDDTWVGWKALAEKTALLAKRYQTDFVFSADSYKTAAELNLYSPEFVYGQNIIGEHALQFDFIGTNLNTLKGKDALFLDSDPHLSNGTSEEGTKLHLYFEQVKELSPIIIEFQGRPVRKFHLFLCKGYRPPQKGLTTELLHN